jgi:phosphate acetyltransferase
MFKEKDFIKMAKRNVKNIVFPEADFSERTINAVCYIIKHKIANVTLLGDEQSLAGKLKSHHCHGVTIINPKTSALREELLNELLKIRKDKGLTKDQAEKLLDDNYYFATMLVQCGYADGALGGTEGPTANVLRPALQIIKAKKGIKTVSSCFIMVGTKKLDMGENNVMILADCALNPNPTADELYDIALSTAETAKTLCNINPKIAMLSFSTLGSGGDKNEIVNKVRLASEKLRTTKLCIDGEMQFDCAVVKKVAKVKARDSKVAGKANILIFPELNSGNIGYKIMQRVGKLSAVGVIMQGLNKPCNDLSRGCSEKDIVTMTAITSLQAQQK